MHIKFNTNEGTNNLLSLYAPTLTSNSETKDAFYSELDAIIKRVPKKEALFLLADFNSRVGNDQESWPICLGHFGVDKCNENGQRRPELCFCDHLCVTITFFSVQIRHRLSWTHPISKHWHQLELIITRRNHLNNVRITRSFHSAYCDTDHSFVCSKIQSRPKKFHRARNLARSRINAATNVIQESVLAFRVFLQTKLENYHVLGTENHWRHNKDVTYNAAMQAFGKKKPDNEYWSDANIAIWQLFIELPSQLHIAQPHIAQSQKTCERRITEMRQRLLGTSLC